MTNIRIFGLLSAVFLLTTALSAAEAQAGPKFMSIWWWQSHWESQDFVPYYANGTEPHNTQWDKSNWKPADWIEMNGGKGEDLIGRWHTAKIISKQYYDDGVPTLDVGVNFYHLSGQDKRRVMETVDYVYQITANAPKIFYLKDPQTRRIIGYYGTDGLILQ